MQLNLSWTRTALPAKKIFWAKIFKICTGCERNGVYGSYCSTPCPENCRGRGVTRRTGGASAAVTAGRDQSVKKEWKTNTVIFLLYNTGCFELCLHILTNSNHVNSDSFIFMHAVRYTYRYLGQRHCFIMAGVEKNETE